MASADDAFVGADELGERSGLPGYPGRVGEDDATAGAEIWLRLSWISSRPGLVISFRMIGRGRERHFTVVVLARLG